MDNVKPFQDRDVVGICAYLSKYCEIYINAHGADLNRSEVKTFHVFFPTLLTYIFGSPNTKGWIQTETHAAQDTAIKEFLSVNGQFFKALLKLSHHLELYPVELHNESLPSDVRKVLSSGSIHLLPSVYHDCSYIVEQSAAGKVDIRQAATLQSSLLPATMGGDRKIKFNMLQFYLYYFVSVATWPPLTPPPLQAQQQSSNTTTSHHYNSASVTRPGVTPTPGSNSPHSQSKTYQYGAVRQPSITPTNTYATQQQSSNTNNIPKFPIYGALRPITYSVYDIVLEEYLTQLVPIKSSNNTFLPDVESFFLDACLELWIRTQWVSSQQKLSQEYMHYVTLFIQYIVRHDLKQCTTDETNKSLLTQVYNLVKEELYMLISRLAINWSKHDDYQQVIELWAIWAAPWKLGIIPRTADKIEYSPIQTGWSLFILDNLPYYFTLVDIFLQRTSTFLYNNSGIQTTPGQPLVNYGDTGTINGQLRILYRLINVMKANGLVDNLGYVEMGFKKIQSGTSTSSYTNPIKKIAMLTYGSETMEHIVYKKLNQVYDVLKVLDGTAGVWKPKGLYATELQPRAENLIKNLVVLNNAAMMREGGKGWGVSNNNEKSAKHAAQLKEAYDQLHRIFKISGHNHLNSTTATDTKATTANSRSTATTITTHTKMEWIKPEYVGSNNGGFLTSEERRRIISGKALSSYDNIHPVGERAITYVRSYESALLVRWIVRLDVYINEKCNQYLPPAKRPAFLPKKITLRPMARKTNFMWTVGGIFLVFYIFLKLIF